jgi:hypothetical protein
MLLFVAGLMLLLLLLLLVVVWLLLSVSSHKYALFCDHIMSRLSANRDAPFLPLSPLFETTPTFKRKRTRAFLITMQAL